MSQKRPAAFAALRPRPFPNVFFPNCGGREAHPPPDGLGPFQEFKILQHFPEPVARAAAPPRFSLHLVGHDLEGNAVDMSLNSDSFDAIDQFFEAFRELVKNPDEDEDEDEE